MKRKNSSRFNRDQISNFKKSGYTLVELLVFMGIVSILLAILSNMFAQIVDVRQESESVSSIEQDGNYILTRLAYDVLRAQIINTPASLGQNDSTLDISIDGVNNLYTANNGILTVTNNNGSFQLNGANSSISNLDFLRLGNPADTEREDTLRISFTVTSRIVRSSGPESKNFQTTVGLRLR
ncbi:hypothetical protein A3C98_04430 [Candidatus Roizmanbacteria bacterium RIFCSPHIGHO2_02_FULL_37_15]|nr:MAG: hypothetical protein A2859_01685 [Candidatus Roizmanbacteria bacterium RIFCSPHIGHO2_01_FULL_37_16b]OGK20739.1 MAG: hypothetical protein A3C98_04430 [Candidatus Roizmanbacteria bacterium RIFCSPHIGHO2_02_FULL_37_15]OGK33025.1 MAG: hypothetical protein A3F57_06535 [Candidatus Roizmanbacteria bacterium RIFCSPHIGHO2_12_FULL_36_11]OGK57643.1 MAG: hypothetical protein A3I50_00800 [Candidatus Roizmanbacteria bacterium RIFCSPLOWO2_02_FULL_37_9]